MMMKNYSLRMLAAITAAALVTGFASCDDDNGGGGGGGEDKAGAFFISVQNSEASAEYLIQTDDIDSGELTISDNFSGDLESNGYTWVFNGKPSRALGLIYNQGDPGLGLLYGVNAAGKMTQIGAGFQISTRFTSYGFFGNYAVTSVGGVAVTHDDGIEREDGATFNKINLYSPALVPTTIKTLDVFRPNEQATFSGVVDLGDGTFMTGAVVSQAIDESATGGSSTGTVNYPDECWVAVIDGDFNIKKTFKSDKISYSSGRYRSQYYSQIGKTDDGTIYVFSGAYDANATVKAGAVKVNNAVDGFDDSYYFDIQTAANNYKFKRVWYISGHYFLIELYDSPGNVSYTLQPASHYGVVDMQGKTFRAVTGLPAQAEYDESTLTETGNVGTGSEIKGGIVSTGQPMGYNGKMYLPVTGYGEDPVIYIIDPATGVATKGLSVSGASVIRAVGRVVEE